jgi:hypothetical protein
MLKYQVLLLLFSSSHAFLIGVKTVSGLAEICQSLEGTQLDVRLAVGEQPRDQMFHLQGMKLKLSTEKLLGQQMPGPSIGAYEVVVQEDPFFTNMKGRQSVTFQDGRWELFWSDMNPQGYLVFGFDVPEGVSRYRMAYTLPISLRSHTCALTTHISIRHTGPKE